MVSDHFGIADGRSDVHLNAELSTPRSQVLEQLGSSVGFHQGNHLALAGQVNAMQQFKTFKAIVEAAAIEVVDEFAVAGELAIDVGEGSDYAVELHGKKAVGGTLWPQR